MANINGFQMKNIKTTMGREGEGCVASLYLNGKRIGTYADYADGAMGNAEYLSKEAEQEMVKFIIAYAKKHPDDYIVNLYKERPKQFKEECECFKKYHPYIPDEDITMETMSANSIDFVVQDFLILYYAEKDFKKWTKKGYRAIDIEACDLTAYPESWTDKKIQEFHEKNHPAGKLYTSLDDFNIN